MYLSYIIYCIIMRFILMTPSQYNFKQMYIFIYLFIPRFSAFASMKTIQDILSLSISQVLLISSVTCSMYKDHLDVY